jgi:hypothetical protein
VPDEEMRHRQLQAEEKGLHAGMAATRTELLVYLPLASAPNSTTLGERPPRFASYWPNLEADAPIVRRHRRRQGSGARSCMSVCVVGG